MMSLILILSLSKKIESKGKMLSEEKLAKIEMQMKVNYGSNGFSLILLKGLNLKTKR